MWQAMEAVLASPTVGAPTRPAASYGNGVGEDVIDIFNGDGLVSVFGDIGGPPCQ